MTNSFSRLYDRMEDPERRKRTAAAFLPAALEIQETPASPIGRLIIWLIVALFVITVVWATFGEIDVVAVAPGKIVPSERVKTIQPLEIGTIQAIHVRDGDAVTQGQPLITLDPTQSEADELRVLADLLVARTELARQESFQRFLEEGDGELRGVPGALSEPQRFVQERLLAEQISEYVAQGETLESQRRERLAEQARVQAEVQKLEKTFPLIRRRAEAMKQLHDQRLAAESAYLELEQARIEVEQDLKTQQARAVEVAAALDALEQQVRVYRAEALRANLTAIQESQRRVDVLEQDGVKATQRNRQRVLHAPIDGVVHDLNVFTVGGVVTPAEHLMSIVPVDGRLEVEALVLNRDIGFVEDGQRAEVKVDTFNFTKYGAIDGELVDISRDASTDEQLGLVYLATVSLARSSISVNDKWVNLTPGMSVTVEVKTGTRKIIEFFLSPLLRYRDESIRER